MSPLKTCIVAAVVGLTGSSLWGQTFQQLHSFPANGHDWIRPVATLTVGPTEGPNDERYLYGTTVEGGVHNAGTLFKVSLTGSVTTVADFDPETTGRFPYTRLLNTGDGSLYGVTENSSLNSSAHEGTVYRFTPGAGLSQVFQIPTAIDDVLTPIPTHPRALVSVDSSTLHVLCADYPGLWQISRDGSAGEVVYTFGPDPVDGRHARTLIQGTDGYFYGTLIGSADVSEEPNGCGAIFRISPTGEGMTILHECDPETGTRPEGALVEGPDGNFYGVMRAGGESHDGCIFRLTPQGDYTILHEFGVRAYDLEQPWGGLVLATDGYLYGTARQGGAPASGGVFRIKPNGDGYKVIHIFKGENGAYPEGGLVQAPDGNLYGTTTEGGTDDVGTVFRIKLNVDALPENRPPVAVDDLVVSTGPGDEVEIQVRDNDFDPDGDRLTVSIKNAPAFGTAVMQPGGVILYTPNQNYDGNDQFTYTVTDGRGGASVATVYITDTEPDIERTGSYQGLLMLDQDLDGGDNLPRAQFSLKLEDSGRFTGVLSTMRKRVPFRGTFTSKGIAVVNLKLPNKRAAALFLRYDAVTPNTIFGVLFGPEIWSGRAGLARTSWEAANYTVSLGTNPSLPLGFSYGVMKVTSKGLVSVVGKLGDGTKLSWGSTVVSLPDNTPALPLFSEPVKDGVCGGWAFRETDGPADFSGSVRWKRPASKSNTLIDAQVEVGIARFIPPVVLTPVLDVEAGHVVLSSPKLSDSVAGAFTLDGQKVNPELPLRSLSFDRKTGLFSGKMNVEIIAGKKVQKKTLSFQGVVTQPLNFGVGQFSINGETGSVLLQSAQNP